MPPQRTIRAPIPPARRWCTLSRNLQPLSVCTTLLVPRMLRGVVPALPCDAVEHAQRLALQDDDRFLLRPSLLLHHALELGMIDPVFSHVPHGEHVGVAAKLRLSALGEANCALP